MYVLRQKVREDECIHYMLYILVVYKMKIIHTLESSLVVLLQNCHMDMSIAPMKSLPFQGSG